MTNTHRFEVPEAIRKTENMPSLPTVAVDVLRLSRDPDATIDELAAAVSLDPALAAKIMKVANSPLYRRGTEIATLPRAAMVLGLKTVKLLALSFSLTSSFPRGGALTSFNYDGYWRHSLTTATIGRELSRLIKSSFAEEAFLCGLLGRVGQLVMANAIPDEYVKVVENISSVLPSTADEVAILEYDYRQVTAALLSSWELPELITHSVYFAHDPEELPNDCQDHRQLCRILQVADLLSNVICEADKGAALRDVYALAQEFFGLAENEIDRFIVTLQEQIAETADALDVDTHDLTDHNLIVDEARQQLLQISLGTEIDLRETKSRTEKLEQENQKLESAATTDGLTKLANRASFDATFQSIVKARLEGRSEAALGILVLDVDHFKSFNDTHGHLVGDQVLVSVASWLKDATRGTDFVARYGGEEFVVVLPNTNVQDLEAVAERLRARVEAGSVECEGKSLSVTISVGGACVQEVGSLDDNLALLKLADTCLYEAKESGRNRSVCRDVEMLTTT